MTSLFSHYFLPLFNILIIIVLINYKSFVNANNRAKRFVSGFSPFGGGNFGCVVSGGKLFINGRFTKNLSEAESEEMDKYIKELALFKESAKAFVQQQQQFSVDTKREQPEAPKRPSFCSENATTQYVFDGCTVQGDYVYIGDKSVRKLNEQELEKLQQFKQEFNVYQEAIANKLKKQMEKLLTAQLRNNEQGEALSINNTNKEEDDDIKSNSPIEPKSPDFCTLII